MAVAVKVRAVGASAILLLQLTQSYRRGAALVASLCTFGMYQCGCARQVAPAKQSSLAAARLRNAEDFRYSYNHFESLSRRPSWRTRLSGCVGPWMECTGCDAVLPGVRQPFVVSRNCAP